MNKHYILYFVLHYMIKSSFELSNDSTESTDYNDYNTTTSIYYNSSTEILIIVNKKLPIIATLIIGFVIIVTISVIIVLFIFGKQKLKERLDNEVIDDNLEIPQLNDSWKCVRCLLTNANSYSNCMSCGFEKRVKQQSEIEQTMNNMKDSDVWNCNLCGFLNSNSRYSCEMCRQYRNILTTKALMNRKSNDKTVKSRLSRGESHSLEQLRNIEEIETINRWNSIVTFCRKYHYIFIDQSFAASNKSLYFNGKSYLKTFTDPLLTKSYVTQWLRPNMIKTNDKTVKEWKVFDNPLPSDICQGCVGDCWFLSAITVLAENPKFIEKLIIPTVVCSCGAYLVRLCCDGKWTTVLIDDLLPCDSYCRLVYSRAKRKQLFVSLIEKSMAKLYGCYEALKSGQVIEALSTLTGSPCESIALQVSRYSKNAEPIDYELIWSYLLHSREMGFLMGASCGGDCVNYSDKHYKNIGLTPRHAYSVLDVKNIKGKRLLKLRDPWGKNQWNGEWSKSSMAHNQTTITQILDYNRLGDGMFWISFNDVIKYFGCIDICKLRPNWNEIRVEGLLPSNAKHTEVVLLTVSHTTQVEFNLFQKGMRGQPNSKRNQLDLCIAVFSVQKSTNINELTYKAMSKRELHSFVWCNTTLETGIYAVICYAFNHWQPVTEKLNNNKNKNNYPKFVLAIHSSHKLLVETTFGCNVYILADSIINITIEKGIKTESYDAKLVIYKLSKQWSGLVIVVENRFDDHYVNVRCDSSNSYNCVSTRNILNTEDNIPPMHRQVIVLLTTLKSCDYAITQCNLTYLPQSDTNTNLINNNNIDSLQTIINNKPAINSNISGLHTPRPL